MSEKKKGDEAVTEMATEAATGLYLAANTRFHGGHPRRFTEGGRGLNESFLLSARAVQRMEETWKGYGITQKKNTPSPTTVQRIMEVFRRDPLLCSPVPRGGAKVNGVAVDIVGTALGFICEDCGEAWEVATVPTDTALEHVTFVVEGDEIHEDGDGNLHYIPGVSLTAARTQKAKGLYALAQGDVAKTTHMRLAAFSLAQDWPQLLAMWSALHGAMPGKVFVRACPVRPRHGFVDSRLVTSRKALRDLYDETLAADPLGEWLLGRMIPAESSAVITPTSIAVGPGHDGATAGTGCLTLPLARDVGLRMEDMPEALQKHAAIALPEQPYIELVMEKGELAPYLTQLRAGLATPRSMDFIPEAMVVQKVLRAEGSHLLWEKTMMDLRNGAALAQGVVVDHVGGSMISHFTLHAVANGVPLLTSRHPRVGEHLKPTEGATESYSREHFLNGLYAYYAEKKRNMRQVLPGAIYAFHQSAWLRGEASYLLGWSIGAIHHAGVMAVSGESRHALRRGHRNAEGKPIPWEEDLAAAFPPGKARSEIFQLLLDDPARTREYLPLMTRAMRGAEWEGGYGGSLWNLCLGATLKLDNALIALHATSDAAQAEEILGRIIGITNQLLHLAHNNGWWFNKFISPEVMNLPYWKASQGWMLPSLLQYVFPGLQAMRQRATKAKMITARGWWEKAEVVPDTLQSLPCAWGHKLRQAHVVVPKGKGFSWKAWVNNPEPQKAFVVAQWNFGSGLQQSFLLTHAERKVLAQVSGEQTTWQEALPIWLQDESERSHVKFTLLQNVSPIMIDMTTGIMRTEGGELALGAPIPMTGLDNDVHESLLGEALTWL